LKIEDGRLKMTDWFKGEFRYLGIIRFLVLKIVREIEIEVEIEVEIKKECYSDIVNGNESEILNDIFG